MLEAAVNFSNGSIAHTDYTGIRQNPLTTRYQHKPSFDYKYQWRVERGRRDEKSMRARSAATKASDGRRVGMSSRTLKASPSRSGVERSGSPSSVRRRRHTLSAQPYEWISGGGGAGRRRSETRGLKECMARRWWTRGDYGVDDGKMIWSW